MEKNANANSDANINEKPDSPSSGEPEKLRIGVFVCDCGSNIAGVIDVASLVEFASGLKDVVFAEEGKWICAVDYLTKIKEHLTEHDLNRVVVACCTPRTHEPTFKATLKEAGLNPYLLEFVSIREQSSWVHKNDPDGATETAKDLIRMGVAKARYLEPGEELRIPVGKECMVIGGGVSGITAALALGDLGFKVLLVERSDALGGLLKNLHKLSPEDVSAAEFIDKKIERVLAHEKISVKTGVEVSNVKGYIGNFDITLSNTSNQDEEKTTQQYLPSIQSRQSEDHKVSTIIVATGMVEIFPSGLFGFGEFPNVVTQLQFEQWLKNEDERIKEIKNIGFINCVTSRNHERGCCNVGCLSTIKNIKSIKVLNPDINTFQFFRDFNITGTDVQYHYDAMDKYFASFRYPDNDPPTVTKLIDPKKPDATRLVVQTNDILTGDKVKIEVDLLVLVPGYQGDPSSQKLKGLLKVSTNPDGFFTEAHVKLRPLDFANEGIYVCGCARSPKNVTESMEEAIGAAMRAAIPMEREYVEGEGIVADVDLDACLSCGICSDACAFGAPEIIDSNLEFIKAICKGCGTCAASCPGEAIEIVHYSDQQLLSQVEAALADNPEKKIIAFACHWCALGAVDNAGVSRFEYPSNIRIIRVMCSGRVDPKFILRAFELGAAGVLVAGCEVPTCHYITGNFYAEKKVYLTKKLLELVGINQNRLRLEWLSAAHGARFAEVVKGFNAELDELGELKKDDFLDIEMNAILKCGDSPRLRLLSAKLKEFADTGNKYGEEFTIHELDRLTDEIVHDEFLKNRIILKLKDSNRSVVQLSEDLNVPTDKIFKTILALKKDKIIKLSNIEDNIPYYQYDQGIALVVHKEPNDVVNSETLPIDNSNTSIQNKFDHVIFGSTFSALEKALQYANNNKSVCLVSSECSFIPEPWMLSEFHHDYQQYKTTYQDLLKRVFENENVKILRNTELQNQPINSDENSAKLELKKKVTFVDETKCDNCGKCSEVCPVNILDLDRFGLKTKHAIYQPWPNMDYVKYAISKGVPYCQVSCAINMDVRGYIGKISDGDLAGALEIMHRTNPLPEVCGKVCDHACESTCARGFKDEPLMIRQLKRYAAEKQYDFLQKHGQPIFTRSYFVKNTDPTNKVAIIGSGPAGLAAAQNLATWGYPVTIFEAASKPGGMLRTGIPDYRLPPQALQRELEAILGLGVDLKLDSPIGLISGSSQSEKTNISKLKEQGYKAVFIAVGAQKGLRLGVEGENLKGVINGIEFLRKINLDRAMDETDLGNNVAVIGGGNVAIDCARTAKRLGAKNVSILYRRTQWEMPAATEELEGCLNEGIKIEYLVAPKRIMGEHSVKCIECQHTELGPPDRSGRRRPVIIEGSEFTIDVDSIIVAVSQVPDLTFISEEDQFELTPKGTFIVDPKTGATNISGIFAGGDVVTGPANVVGALNWGRTAARAIHQYLSPDNIGVEYDNFPTFGEKRTQEMELLRLRKNQLLPDSAFEPVKDREPNELLDPETRINNFNEVERLMENSSANAEAIRCLSCRMCIGCGVCQAACPKDAIDYSLRDEQLVIEVKNMESYSKLVEGKFNDRYELKTLYKDSLNVLSPMELEYMLTQDGVFDGQIQRPSDGKIPTKIGFLNLPEQEFVTPDDKKLQNLELVHMVKLMNIIKHNFQKTKISMFTKNLDFSELPNGFQYLIDTIKIDAIKDDIRLLGKEQFEFNIEKQNNNIDVVINDENTNFDLVIISTGLNEVNK
jgi:heterodisulfide reductase subunit A